MQPVVDRPTYTFKDSGITVTLRKLGPSTTQDVARAVRKQWQHGTDPAKHEPKPPVIQTDVGPEANEADPAYQLKHKAWQIAINEEVAVKLLDFAALYAVDVQIDPEAVERLRETYQMMGLDLDEPAHMTQEQKDKWLYVTRICIATSDDMTEFSAAVLQRSQPTEEAVQAHVDTFSGDVQG